MYEEEKDDKIIRVSTDTDEFVMRGRPCELSAFAFVPTERNVPKERTYFNSERQERYSSSTYDRLFRKPELYNMYLHKDDREHAKSRGLTVNNEEKVKVVPTLSSSDYGHRLDNEYDPPDRKHVRIGHVQSEFYRRNDINIKDAKY
ncbi:uncharacterized protein C5orf49 homolog [Lingula anatina]|uniref:Uncharacterized protein C5orf49 homolog n=1 Tax=Lingula anatina TaxID=7574 RepID=A0A1S3KFI7_LINAN|nr:uncharacterized protein C5orf49 homolog [Lingula anatina]XP_013421224.1 uncharacterized protein C5orf49 homolog [Lingula anatina]|eukprot:XP_013382418.1 uncharacterized protein C5orf49 homolog [Lingula anatina]